MKRTILALGVIALALALTGSCVFASTVATTPASALETPEAQMQASDAASQARIDMLDDELIAALKAELEAESGARVFPLSGAAKIGLDPVLDSLLEAIGPEGRVVSDDDEGEDAVEWSPI